MPNVITIGPEHVPVEQIAYIEPFEPPANGQFRPDKPYKGRVVLLNRETVLTEETPKEFATEAGASRQLSAAVARQSLSTEPLGSLNICVTGRCLHPRSPSALIRDSYFRDLDRPAAGTDPLMH